MPYLKLPDIESKKTFYWVFSKTRNRISICFVYQRVTGDPSY